MGLLPLCCTFVFLFSTTTICNAALTTTCTADSNCTSVANSKCPVDGNSKVCQCLPAFKQDANTEACVAKVLGDPCTANGGECANIANSSCVAGGESALNCTCKATHKPKDQSCVSKVLGDSCTENGGECAGIANSSCVDDAGTLKCTCKATHKQVEGSCVRKGLGDSCKAPSDCNTDDAICGSTSKHCECGSGFVAQSGACKVAVDDDCSDDKLKKCVGNAECKENKCMCSTNYIPDVNFCVPENGSRGNLASFIAVIISLATAFQF